MLTAVDTTTTTTTTTTDSSSSSTTLGQEDFLMLLTTQIAQQDPMDPYDSDTMTEQMTQYSQLEQTVTTNDLLEGISDQLTAMSAVNSFSYLGMEVEADGSTITKSGEDVSALNYSVSEDANTVIFNIYDESGSIVDTRYVQSVEAGSHSFEWDGYDYNDAEADDGTYTITATAYDENGDEIDLSTSATGIVSGVAQTSEGIILTLEDGREVNITDVTNITQPTSTTSEES